MNKLTKITLLALLLLLALPMRQYGQTPYRQYADEVIESHDANMTQTAQIRDYENGFLFNVFQIENVEERIQLASALATSDIWLCNPTDNPGELFIRPNSYHSDIPIYAEFDYLRMTLREEYEEASSLPKEEFGEIVNSWAHNISNDYYNFLISDHLDRANHCMDAEPFCTTDVYNFPALNSGYSWSGPNYGCLNTSPTTHHSFWYYMRIGVAGNITIKIEADFDVDFALWGPFNNQTDPCPTAAGQAGMLTATCSSCPNNTSSSANYPYGNLHDCSFDARHYEYAHVVNGQVGQYFILLITNWSGSAGNITFQKYAGDGETDCGILPPLVNNNGPYCVGETINLTANGQAGASYSWSGPGGFTSTQQNPTRPNCTMAMSGTYTCTISLGGSTNSASTEVIVYPMPSANFNFTTVCVGTPTQFTSTSTTNPSGQQIQNYQWNFGDGQTGTGANVSHTYASAGTYQVTLTVNCGGHCTSTKTQTITVTSQPTANFTYTTVCQGNATQFTSTSVGQGITSYQWNFGDGQTGSGQTVNHTYANAGTYQVTLTVSTSGGTCSDDITQTVTVNSQPTSNFTYTSVCRGNPTQFTSTSTGQGISTFQWNFGDGQTGSGQTVTHTYAQAGDYQVTLTVSTSGHCTDQKTQTVPVYAQPTPTITATPPTVGYGGVATLTANPGVQGTFSFHWEPANMVVSPNNQTTQTVPLYANQAFTVTVTNPEGGCNGETQVTVPMDGSGMSATATADQNELCEGESTTLHVTPLNGSGSYTYSWTPANSLNNANTQNPVATPPVGTTTYSCHVSDGVTAMDVSVTILVHPNEVEELEHTICDNDTYNFYGQDVNEPNVYEYHTQTEFGCDKLIRLHLYNWETYETPTYDHYCNGDTYSFFGQQLTEPGTYYHTLESVHHCDSVIRFTLIKDPTYEFTRTESTCEGGEGYLFDDGQYYQPSPEPYIFHYETTAGCDSTIILQVNQSDYNSKTYNISICDTEYTWVSNGNTYFESGTYYDTLQYSNTCDSVVVLNLELRRITDTLVRKTSCDRYHWVDTYFGVDKWFEESHYETYEFENENRCPSHVTLDLTINDHDEFTQSQDDSNAIPMYIEYTGIIGCDSVLWNPRGHQYETPDTYNPANHWYTQSSPVNQPYQRTYHNQAGCDSIVSFPLKLDYTPDPIEIRPVDYNNPAPHWVVTATEFQINSYEFNIWEQTHASCKWNRPIEWRFVKRQGNGGWVEDPSVQWILEPDTTTNPSGKKVRMYVLNYIQDTIWLEARVKNDCAPEGITRYYWFKSSFYDVEEQTVNPIDFSVVPNPNNGNMTLLFENMTGEIDIKVYSMTGVLIDHFTTYNDGGPNHAQYNMNHHGVGIYYFVATGKEGTATKKVVIKR